ncbi:MAG: hypothetical protein IJ802_00045 [Kiritimatiellae bacterium]|nr:hypothetical protein [Kiritimatiellia bacterium]
MTDRNGKTTLRSAVTGEDHLYYAMEEISLAQLPHDAVHLPFTGAETNTYRVMQHFTDDTGSIDDGYRSYSR